MECLRGAPDTGGRVLACAGQAGRGRLASGDKKHLKKAMTFWVSHAKLRMDASVIYVVSERMILCTG